MTGVTHSGFVAPITSYDFHVYYYANDPKSKTEAISLKNKIVDDFKVPINEDKLILKVLRDESITGPHIVAFFEVDIEDPAVFTEFFSWIQYHHGTLSVLVHPNSGDVYKDHTEFAGWIGTKLPLLDHKLVGLTGYPDFAFPSRREIKNGFYDDPTKFNKSIMIRLLEKGPDDELW